jgi:hypothetical protein
VVAARNNKVNTWDSLKTMDMLQHHISIVDVEFFSMPYNKICYSTTWDALKLMDKGSKFQYVDLNATSRFAY